MRTTTKISLVTVALLSLTYAGAQIAQDKADGRTATVSVAWTPAVHPTGVRIVVRIAAQDRVKGRVYLKSPFLETYAVKRGDSVLVVTDPVSFQPINIYCSITVSGSAPVTNRNKIPGGSDNGHTVCLTSVH